jgi:hypothetical protein
MYLQLSYNNHTPVTKKNNHTPKIYNHIIYYIYPALNRIKNNFLTFQHRAIQSLFYAFQIQNAISVLLSINFYAITYKHLC